MDYQAITLDINDDIAVLTLNRPDVMNALNTQMRAEIIHAIKAAGREARVLVMTGAGQAFCSGQDLGDGGSAANLDLERTLRDEYEPMLKTIFNSKIPTISAVNGAAAGAGANIALAADVVIASEDAFFCLLRARFFPWYLRVSASDLARCAGAREAARPRLEEAGV